MLVFGMQFYRSVRDIVCAGMVLAAAVLAADEPWHELRDCELIPHTGNDGDSFHVKHGDDHFLFRICFADAPETSRSIPHRIKEQALWWSISEDDVLVYGEAAKTFSLAWLKNGFTVHTQYKDARGRSAMKRNFAMVAVDGEFLSQVLVSAGLARAYGYLPTLPDGTSRWTYRKKLQELERKAKGKRKGAWRTSELPSKPNAMPGEGAEDAPAGKKVVLTRSAALYAAGASAHFLGTLQKGTEVVVLDQPAGSMMNVSVVFHGQRVTGRCRSRDLGL